MQIVEQNLNPGLALIGLSGTGPWWTNTFIQSKSVNSSFRVLISSKVLSEQN